MNKSSTIQKCFSDCPLLLQRLICKNSIAILLSVHMGVFLSNPKTRKDNLKQYDNHTTQREGFFLLRRRSIDDRLSDRGDSQGRVAEFTQAHQTFSWMWVSAWPSAKRWVRRGRATSREAGRKKRERKKKSGELSMVLKAFRLNSNQTCQLESRKQHELWGALWFWAGRSPPSAGYLTS